MLSIAGFLGPGPQITWLPANLGSQPTFCRAYLIFERFSSVLFNVLCGFAMLCQALAGQHGLQARFLGCWGLSLSCDTLSPSILQKWGSIHDSTPFGSVIFRFQKLLKTTINQGFSLHKSVKQHRVAWFSSRSIAFWHLVCFWCVPLKDIIYSARDRRWSCTWPKAEWNERGLAWPMMFHVFCAFDAFIRDFASLVVWLSGFVRGFGIVDPTYTDLPWEEIMSTSLQPLNKTDDQHGDYKYKKYIIICMSYFFLNIVQERFRVHYCLCVDETQVCETKRVDNCGGPEDLDERIATLGFNFAFRETSDFSFTLDF